MKLNRKALPFITYSAIYTSLTPLSNGFLQANIIGLAYENIALAVIDAKTDNKKLVDRLSFGRFLIHSAITPTCMLPIYEKFPTILDPHNLVAYFSIISTVELLILCNTYRGKTFIRLEDADNDECEIYGPKWWAKGIDGASCPGFDIYSTREIEYIPVIGSISLVLYVLYAGLAVNEPILVMGAVAALLLNQVAGKYIYTDRYKATAISNLAEVFFILSLIPFNNN